jgi:hypothetical protein
MALDALRGIKTFRQIAKDFDIHWLQVSERKKTMTASGNPVGTVTGIRRDASGRVTGTSSGTGKCQQPAPVPPPPASVKKQAGGKADAGSRNTSDGPTRSGCRKPDQGPFHRPSPFSFSATWSISCREWRPRTPAQRSRPG